MRLAMPMKPIVLIWLQFAICVVLIGFAGFRLSRYGDAIAALTGLSRNWSEKADQLAAMLSS